MVLKKRLSITSLVKESNARYLKKTQKFGIEVPDSVAQALCWIIIMEKFFRKMILPSR